MTADVVSLEDAVQDAVAQGRAELARLDQITDGLADACAQARREPPPRSDLLARTDALLREFPQEVRRHLRRERASLGSFNVAFFGRTGVGKSTLLSAFGELDGEYVSPGASDWTTEVHHLQWRGCRLFDTPGINGWGRTESRHDLEAKARRAVEVSDIVLLCFDNQNQQEMEFEKIASWIRDHGKPVVAVLNVRNPRWRHPAKVPANGRINLSEPVRQHTDNIRTQLANIGLPDTPIVAINSRRALFARATTPFHGPAQKNFLHEREEFGRDYLAHWSNFEALERLIATSIAEGGADLRLSALREDIQSRCRRAISEFESLAVEIEREAESLEYRVESLFAVLGYPDDSERAAWLHDDVLHSDLVELSEIARGRPYTSPAKGSLDRFARYLADSHLSGCRRQAKVSADDLIQRAFDEHMAIDESAFTKAVFDDKALSTAAEAIWTDREAFLRRELEVVADHLPSGLASTNHGAAIRGDEGGVAAGVAVRGAGIAMGMGVLAVPALANFWNPAGWVLGVVAAGVGVAGQVQQYLGKKMSEQAAERARQAKVEALADCHRAVDQTFDDYEDAVVREGRVAAWQFLAPTVAESLRSTVELRTAHRRMLQLADTVRSLAGSIATAPVVTDVLVRAQRRMWQSPSDIERALLGEDWLDSPLQHQPARIDPAAREVYSRQRDSNRASLARTISAAWNTPSTSMTQSWLNDLEDAARQDPALFDIARNYWRADRTKPTLAVVGDYNSGKSSLIRRILVDQGQSPETEFDILAVPATAAAHRYEFPRFDLVDTPGLQSGHGEHDIAAFEAVAASALVFVVVHINLLIGNTAILEEIVRGSKSIAAKGGRIVLLINRCDELGVDPLTAPDEFITSQNRKREELGAAFASRSIEVDTERIHCLSGDPFGIVGSNAAATRPDFDEHRLWDGVAALTDALAGLSDEQASAAASSAAFDAAVTDLKRHRRTLQQIQDTGTEDLRHTESVISALRAALNDAAILEKSLLEDARRMVDRHALRAKSDVYMLDVKEARKLDDLVASWSRTPLFEADVERYNAEAARKLDTWYSEHTSAIGREGRAAAFQTAPEIADGFMTQGGIPYGDLVEGAGNVAGAAAPLLKALGNRDAVYAIGKQVGHKFKPWGAVKGGAKVAKAGAALAAVAAAVDAASMANDIHKSEEHKERQRSAAQNIDTAGAQLAAQLARGDDGEGPVGYLEQQTVELTALLNEHLDLATSVSELMASAEERSQIVHALVASAENLVGTQGRIG